MDGINNNNNRQQQLFGVHSEDNRKKKKFSVHHRCQCRKFKGRQLVQLSTFMFQKPNGTHGQYQLHCPHSPAGPIACCCCCESEAGGTRGGGPSGARGEGVEGGAGGGGEVGGGAEKSEEGGGVERGREQGGGGRVEVEVEEEEVLSVFLYFPTMTSVPPPQKKQYSCGKQRANMRRTLFALICCLCSPCFGFIYIS